MLTEQRWREAALYKSKQSKLHDSIVKKDRLPRSVSIHESSEGQGNRIFYPQANILKCEEDDPPFGVKD